MELSSTHRMAKKRQNPINDGRSGGAAGVTAPARGSEQLSNSLQPLVGVIMGSSSDWETMEHVAKTLAELGVPHETRVVSAHRTPDLLFEYASSAEKRGIEVIIAGAGGAAHLPGMTASKTLLPVLGVPVESKTLKGLDSLLSIAQMPGGIPVGTLAIGKAGAINAALLAAAILGAKRPDIREALRKFRAEQTERVLANPDPAAAQGASFRLTESPAKRKPA
jgi:5-(carboxyamino)imidazole ribonucleotide mutase